MRLRAAVDGKRLASDGGRLAANCWGMTCRSFNQHGTVALCAVKHAHFFYSNMQLLRNIGLCISRMFCRRTQLRHASIATTETAGTMLVAKTNIKYIFAVTAAMSR